MPDLSSFDPLAVRIVLSATIVLVCGLLIWLAGRLLCWTLRIRHDGKGRRPLRGTAFLLRLLVTFYGLWALAGVWGVRIAAWATTPWGAKLSATGSHVATIIILSVVAFEMTGLALDYALSRWGAHAGHDPRRQSQVDTLAPIIRRIVSISILIIAAITLLSQVGIKVGPILAGAGVVGIAVGFGAQTLVKDFFTGFFLLIEDIVAIGDVVQIQAFSGTVEEMTLRTLRLRDFDGTLHVLPYGEAQIVHNLTKTFSFAAFDLPLRYDTDLEKAMQVIRDTAAAMRRDADWRDVILADMEIAGTDLLSDIGIIVKARIRTQPRERWRVLREFNLRIKQAFDAAGIVMTHK